MADTRNRVITEFTAQDKMTQTVASMKSRVTSDLKSMAIGFVGVSAGVAGVTNAVKQSLNAYMEQEAALNRVRRAGFNNASAIIAQANALEKLNATDAEALAQTAALARAFVDDAKSIRLAEAAMETAAATGKDYDTIARALIRSLSGNTREIKFLIPEIAGLTDEQLRNGAAVDALIAKYGGSAEAEGKTLSGSLKRVQKQAENAQEAYGKLLGAMFGGAAGGGDKVNAAAGPLDNFISQMEGLAIVIEKVNKAFSSGQSDVSGWVDRVFPLAKFFGGAIGSEVPSFRVTRTPGGGITPPFDATTGPSATQDQLDFARMVNLYQDLAAMRAWYAGLADVMPPLGPTPGGGFNPFTQNALFMGGFRGVGSGSQIDADIAAAAASVRANMDTELGTMGSQAFMRSWMDLIDSMERANPLVQQFANGLTNTLSSGFQRAILDGENFFRVLGDGFKRLIAQVLAEQAAKTAVNWAFKLLGGLDAPDGAPGQKSGSVADSPYSPSAQRAARAISPSLAIARRRGQA